VQPRPFINQFVCRITEKIVARSGPNVYGRLGPRTEQYLFLSPSTKGRAASGQMFDTCSQSFTVRLSAAKFGTVIQLGEWRS